MSKLTIDGYPVEVPKGTKVIAAAEKAGILIPRFCYHRSLGSLGACRMCAVKFLEGPVKGVQMSCMVDAADGMVVSTTDEEAVDFRKHVIEWLMENHPHDCPVCDEGGHCLLQDMTVAGGHGIRRYLGEKRTYYDQYLGVFVQHEMNRCIHCWRCRRFYQEFAGYRDLGAMQIGYRTYFGRAKSGPLESPYSGNLIDLCPTGVYTDKPSRFKGRRWDFERSPSLCIHCSLGCHTIASARYREMVRLEAGFSEWVNGYFICDRGRYGFYYTNHPDRPRRARIGKEEVPWSRAIRETAEKLLRINREAGPKSVACVGSVRSSLETQAMLKRFCQLQGWREPAYFVAPSVERNVKTAVSRLDSRLAVSMREIESADFILAVGADPVNEAPMLALAMRQAYRKNATVVVIDPRPVFLPFEFDHLPVPPREIDPCLHHLARISVDRSVAVELGPAAVQFYDAISPDPPFDSFKDRFAVLGQRLRQSQNPIIVCGTEIVRETTPGVAADSALLLQGAGKKAGLFYLLPGANAFGASLLASGESSLIQIIEEIEKGSIKALMLVENDPFWDFPDGKRLEQAIDSLDLLVVMDYLPSRAAQHSHVLLPSTPLFETATSFINQEGRIQAAGRAHCGGVPVAQLTSGSHPPRRFRSDIPGGEPKAAWQILTELSDAMSLSGRMVSSEMSRDGLWQWLAEENFSFANVEFPEEGKEGVRINPGRRTESAFSLDGLAKPEGDQGPEARLQLLLVDWTFGTEELSGYSSYAQQVEKAPCLFMHSKDAGASNLNNRDKVILALDGGPLELELCVVENMSPGVIVLPRHRQIPWQKWRDIPSWVSLAQIGKT